MRRRLNRENALLAFAVLLLCWALVKWGLFLGTRPERLGAARVPRVAIHAGDPGLAGQFPAPPLSRYALGDDPFGLGQDTPPLPPPPPPIPPREKREGDGAVVEEAAGAGRADGNGDEKKRGGHGKTRITVVEPPKDERVVIEPLPHAELPLRLVGTVKAGEDEPVRRALIEDTGTGTVRDARVGDLLPGDYKLGSIQDDSVTVIDARGRFYVLGGRHRVHYD
jgi:hypothetical protein